MSLNGLLYLGFITLAIAGFLLWGIWIWRYSHLRNRYRSNYALLSTLLRALGIKYDLNPTLVVLDLCYGMSSFDLVLSQISKLFIDLVDGRAGVDFANRGDGALAFTAIANYLAITGLLGGRDTVHINTNAKPTADQVASLRSSYRASIRFVSDAGLTSDVPRHSFALAFRVISKTDDGVPVVTIYPHSWSSVEADMDSLLTTPTNPPK